MVNNLKEEHLTRIPVGPIGPVDPDSPLEP